MLEPRRQHWQRFNSRSRVGSDVWSRVSWAKSPLFQFTLPWRARQTESRASGRKRAFQFTLPCRERPLNGHPLGRTPQLHFTNP